ncbi:lipoprotein NlpI [Psychromonas sp. MME2]|uniref:lipoprotein NlpI n=1 Tax=unclassified Psychromonas TaxID=2614957 RepID=UPI00339C7AB1
MKLNFPIISLLTLIAFLSGCQTIPPDTEVSPEQTETQETLPFAFPLALATQVSYEDEVTILRLSQLLTEKKDLTARERAQLFYERGITYDRMGLNAHSRYDFNQAITADPTFPEPYNLLGVYLLLVQSYDEAFDAFDSALELSDKMQYSHLHRAIGLYLAKRYGLANKDIETFYAFDKTDPYRVLWRYIINSQLDEDQALRDLQSEQAPENDKNFAWGIVDVIAGRITEQQFLSSISNGLKSNTELAQRLCEAYFYLGHKHKLAGELKIAIYYFKMSVATNIHDFVEYKYSLMELMSIQQMLQKELTKTVSE